MFEGVSTAIITPFCDGKIDESALRQHIEEQIEAGINGIVPCGTTGESPTLSAEEKKEVIEICIDQAKGRVPIIAGTGNNNTKTSREMTEWAKGAGVDGALIITPYYNKPTQKGLYEHFKRVASVGLPVVIYNVPSRTSVSIEPETVKSLSEIKNIVAIKEATGSNELGKEFLRVTNERITLLSGDDGTFLNLLQIGAKGCISVASNVIPKQMVKLYEEFKDGSTEKAKEINEQILPLIKGLFIETNPIPVKHALALMGKMTNELRLPLCEMEEGHLKTLKELLKNQGLIS